MIFLFFYDSFKEINGGFMAELKDTIIICEPPQKIYGWFINNFAKDYKKWHQEHISAKWKKGKNFAIGSILVAEEYLGGDMEKLRFKTTKNIPNRLIEYKVLFPESIICQGGSFEFEPHQKGSRFTAMLKFRFGSVSAKIMSKKAEAIKKHMKEEGENLKKILEN